MKPKRVAEHQINKDEYEANVDERDIETPDPGQGMSRASDDVMKRRKIVRASRKSTGGPGATPSMAPPTGQFTGVGGFKPQTATTPAPSTEATPMKANPFANISFASSAPAPAYSFGAPAAAKAAPPSAVKPKAASNGFSFGSNSANTAAPSFAFGAASQQTNNSNKSKALFQTTTPEAQREVSVPKFSTPPSSKVGSFVDKSKTLNEGFFKWAVAAWDCDYFAQDWSSGMVEYEQKVDALVEEDGSDASVAEENGDVNVSNPNQNNDTKFSFGATAPPAASQSAATSAFGNAFGATAQAASGFSFNLGATPASAPSTSQPFVAFGSIPPPSTSGASSNTTDDDDPTANPDDGKIEVGQEKNTEEDILIEVRLKPMISKEGGWKKYGAGACRLYRHKTTFKHRLVMRNDAGKVMFNVAVNKEMEFSKEVKDGKKGKTAFIKFIGVEDAKEGPKLIALQVALSDVDKLHCALEGMKE